MALGEKLFEETGKVVGFKVTKYIQLKEPQWKWEEEDEEEISEMTDEKLEEETNQTRTKTIQAKEFIKGKIPLDDLPQPYVLISDSGEFENLSKTITF